MRAEMEQKMLANKNGRITTDCLSPYTDCPEGIYTIPVVFHIVRNEGEDPYVSDGEVYNTLKELNQYFAGTHPDQTSIPSMWLPFYSGDTKIKFVLASVDPWGNPHSGIIRKSTQKSSFMGPIDPIDLGPDEERYTSDDTEFFGNIIPCVKRDNINDDGSTAWPSDKYLNIWVCDLYIEGLLGFSTFPKWDTYFPQFSGIAVEPAIVQETHGFNRAIVTHEVGHWLNLLHTFTHGCYDYCDYLAGDLCEDTPRDKKTSS